MHRLILCLAVLVVLAGTVSATTLTETPDVGQTLGTSFLVPGGTTQINGSVSSSDADLYRFFWGGGDFYVNSVGSSFDSQLFLFNSTGQGVQGNDDGVAFAGPAYLQLTGLAQGTYYLGISGFDLDPYSSSGIMFQSFPFEPLYGPSNSDPLTHWAGGGQGGDYQIHFRQFTGEGQGPENPVGGEVPEPATLILLGSGLAGLFLRKRAA